MKLDTRKIEKGLNEVRNGLSIGNLSRMGYTPAQIREISAMYAAEEIAARDEYGRKHQL